MLGVCSFRLASPARGPQPIVYRRPVRLPASGTGREGCSRMFWWLMKYMFLGPILRLFFHPKTEGLEHIPAEGPVILAPNHLSFADDLLVPLVLKGRRATILAKSDYWDHWYTRWFFEGAGCVPVRRDGGSASRAAIDAAVKALREGRMGMRFPE